VQPVLAEREVVAEPTPSAELPPQIPGSPDAGFREPAPEAVVRVCDSCGATMDSAQDWCLECGTAAPGRLGSRTGWRSMGTIIALTLLLVGGAVAASYAALSEDAKLDASRPGQTDVAPVAQIPPTLPAASAPTGAAGAVVTGPAGVTPAGGLPTVKTPVTPTTKPSTPVTVTPVTPVTPITPTDSDSTGTGGTSGESDTTTPEEDDTAATTRSLTGIELPADAVSVYDPYKRVTVKGDVADAYDGDRDTTFRIGTADATKPMGVGLVVDLEKTTAVRAVELLTDTPGYRVEIYGAKGDTLPPDILDARWEHFADRSKVDEGKKDGNVPGDDKDRISLRGERKVRYLVLWMTTPPAKGPTVRIAELNLFQ